VTAIVLAVGSVAGDVIANRIGDDPGLVTWIVVAVALAAVIVLSVLNGRYGPPGPEPDPSVRPQGPGVVTDLPGVARFVGRRDELARIAGALDHVPVVVVVGRRGIGTSSCAVEAANQVREAERDRFAHGQIYLDLRSGGRPVGPRGLLDAMAAKVQVPPPASSRRDELTAAANRIREALDGQRVLLVLDNVTDPSQVEPLLPLPDGCQALVAGGPALGRLAHRAELVRVEEPGTCEAVAMCAAASPAAAVVADRAAELRDDPVTAELVDLCGRQPRAVGVLGLEITRQGWQLDELASAFRRVVAAPPHQDLRCEEPLALVAAHDVAYAALGRSARRLYRLLSLTPEPLDREGIAALRGPSLRRLRGPLDELIDGAFVVGDGHRYGVRPVLAANARLHLRLEEPVRRRGRAQARLVRHLVRRAERHARRLVPASPGSSDLSLDGDPRVWFTSHDQLLRSLVVSDLTASGLGGEPPSRRVRRWWFRLAVALCTWFERMDRPDDRKAVCQAALATRTGRDRAKVAGWARNELGAIERQRGNLREARRQLTLALAQGGYRGRAQRYTNLGLVLLDEDTVVPAIEHLRLARQHRSRSDPVGAAVTDLALGCAYLRWGALSDARTALRSAADAFRGAGRRDCEAAALTNLGVVLWELDERRDALEAWTEAVRLYRTVDDPDGLAAALLDLGAALLDVDRSQAAGAHLLLSESQALRPRRRPSAGRGRALLHRGRALEVLGEEHAAHACWQLAERTCGEAGDHEGAAAAASHRERLPA